MSKLNSNILFLIFGEGKYKPNIIKIIDNYKLKNVLLNKFVGSSFQEDIEIKIFINEELERIRASVKKSMQLKEVKEDEIMLENSEKILQKVDSFKKKQRYSENDFVLILKMQQLVKEIES